jgi:hypothetical protein
MTILIKGKVEGKAPPRSKWRRAVDTLKQAARKLEPYVPLLLAPFSPVGMVYLVPGPEVKELDVKLLRASSTREIIEVLRAYKKCERGEALKSRIHLALHLRKLYRLREKLIRGEKLPTHTVVIPDLHAQAGALARILGAISDEPILEGDYFDRRDGNLKVFNLLRKKKIILWGNHETKIMFAMRGDVYAFISWMANGGVYFLGECGINIDPIVKKYVKVMAKMPEKDQTMDKIFKQVLEEDPILIKALLLETMDNSKLRKIFRWLVKAGRLYHLDENGILYLHSLVPLKEADPEVFARMDKLQADVRRVLKTERPSMEELVEIQNRLSLYQDIRDDDLLFPLLKGGEGEVRRYVRNLGIMGIVYGHTIKPEVQVYANRLFGIDLGMAEDDQGSYFVIGREGIKSHREAADGKFAERQIMTGADFQKLQSEEIDLIIEGVKNYFARKFTIT